mmetsp:Transcript_50362/g.146411  ORF Transcript_50362/g.146411 Transcript_50362/m.146411 type:complete len:208 (+) Transcript_50362:111-734(+)
MSNWPRRGGRPTSHARQRDGCDGGRPIDSRLPGRLPPTLHPRVDVLPGVEGGVALVCAHAARAIPVALLHEKLTDLEFAQAHAHEGVLAHALPREGHFAIVHVREVLHDRFAGDDLDSSIHHRPAVAPTLAPTRHLVAVRHPLARPGGRLKGRRVRIFWLVPGHELVLEPVRDHDSVRVALDHPIVLQVSPILLYLVPCRHENGSVR